MLWLALFMLTGGPGDVPAPGVEIELSDGWAPRMLSEDHPYRPEFVRLADRPASEEERFLELYGIPPSFTAVRARLLDEERHRCHAAVDATPLTSEGEGARAQVRAAQAHLRCDRLLAHEPDGQLDAATVAGLRSFQRSQAIIGASALDGETRLALATSSRELDFRTLLRVLRERVVDATGVIEDGSASRRGTVLGRRLDCSELRWTDRLPALPGGAPDLVSRLTEQAARALGWTDPEAAVAYFRDRWSPATASRVRLPLDPAPLYHGPEMVLRAQIVTGGRRPELRLITRPPGTQGAADVVLVRWPTTKGGWQAEKTGPTSVALKMKPSAMGSFVWRDLIAAPAWFPPDTTPDEELVRKTGQGFRLNREVIGPGYRSAYGLVMLIHHRPPPLIEEGESPPVLYDAQTRTHGTANVRSVLHGDSHGCHRLYSALAVRLATFLLEHRRSVRRGTLVAHYRRIVSWQGRRMALRADNRGYLYELTPPVPVRVSVRPAQP
ncbi:MAG TPA: hypothetical protein VMT03_02480 [Polyangia bacterium]|nr:hypothetical protein [Polyangia bacterium]